MNSKNSDATYSYSFSFTKESSVQNIYIYSLMYMRISIEIL